MNIVARLERADLLQGKKQEQPVEMMEWQTIFNGLQYFLPSQYSIENANGN